LAHSRSNGLVEALYFPGPARRVGRRDDVTDAALDEQRAQLAVVGVGPGAVGHQAAGVDATRGKPGQGAAGEGGDGVGAFVAQQFAVGHA
jgi:hypothetical protein